MSAHFGYVCPRCGWSRMVEVIPIPCPNCELKKQQEEEAQQTIDFTCPTCTKKYTIRGSKDAKLPKECPTCADDRNRHEAHVRMYPEKGKHLNLRVIPGGKK